MLKTDKDRFLNSFLTQLSFSSLLFNKISCNFSPMLFGWANSRSFFAVVANSSSFNSGFDDIRNFAIVSLILGTGRFPRLFCNSSVLGPISVFRLLGTTYFVEVEDLSKVLLNDAVLIPKLPRWNLNSYIVTLVDWPLSKLVKFSIILELIISFFITYRRHSV